MITQINQFVKVHLSQNCNGSASSLYKITPIRNPYGVFYLFEATGYIGSFLLVNVYFIVPFILFKSD